MLNNARTQIVGTLGASDTSLIITAGEGPIFGTDFPIKSTLEQFQNGVVIKREIINITAINGDVFTIERAVEECVQDDSAQPKTRTQDQYSFQDGDFLSVYVTEDYYTGIQNQFTNIEDNLLPTKVDRPNIVNIATDYTFTGNETNNTQFNVDTTSAETTLTIDLSLFPNTNGLYQFTVVKTSGDSNAVVIDVGAGSLSGESSVELVNENQIVKFVIESGTTATIISEKNEPTEQVDVAKTTINKVALDNFIAGETAFLNKYQIGIQDFGTSEETQVQSSNFGVSGVDGIIVAPDESQIGLIFNDSNVISLYVYDLSVPGDITSRGSPTIFGETELDLYFQYWFTYSHDGSYVYAGRQVSSTFSNKIERASLSTPYDLKTIGTFVEYMNSIPPLPSAFVANGSNFSVPFFSDDGTKIIFNVAVRRSSDSAEFLMKLVYETDTIGEYQSNNLTILDYELFSFSSPYEPNGPWYKNGKYLIGKRLSSHYEAFNSATETIPTYNSQPILINDKFFYTISGGNTVVKSDVSNCFYQEIEFGTNSKQQLSQEFIGLGYLEQIMISTSLYGTIDNNIIVEIQGDNNGEPDGNVIFTSTEVINASLNISSKTVSIQTTLDTNTRYHLVFKSQVALDDNNYYLLQGNKEKEIISKAKYYDGTNWILSDISLAIVYRDYYGVIKDGTGYQLYDGATFLGIANTNTSIGSMVEINRQYDNNQSGLTPNRRYKPGTTPGTIELSATDGSDVDIATAISTTDLILWDGTNNY